MRKKLPALLTTVAVLCGCALGIELCAQAITTPRGPSPAAEVTQTIGISTVTITYSRPAVRGREIWGTQLAHYGYQDPGFGTATAAPWRAGANENTTITFSHDAMLEGEAIPAGTYGFFLGLHEDGSAEAIFSQNSTSWGHYFYDEREDQLRVKIQSTEIPHTERLTFNFVDINDQSAVIALDWEKRRYPVRVEFDVHNIVLANARNELRSVAGFTWQGPVSAAQYCLQNNINHEEAMKWADQAIANSKNFNTLFVKAGLMEQAGKDATPTYDEAAALASNQQRNFLAYQMMTSGNNEKALSYFKTNVEKFPDDPNVHDSLGEYYKNVGEKKLAIRSLKKSLSLDPPANIKANSLKLLEEMGVDVSEYN